MQGDGGEYAAFSVYFKGDVEGGTARRVPTSAGKALYLQGGSNPVCAFFLPSIAYDL